MFVLDWSYICFHNPTTIEMAYNQLHNFFNEQNLTATSLDKSYINSSPGSQKSEEGEL